ncbi:hypothetical protein [Encephalitozoon cuniculi GB-M1]|uniref:Uncharacterized protein n=2 Tax=Encephalitozoon cuniculi TaxID=6035 RepID=Q8STQ2_ENCCU|nr:uncharacterized protein ECU09_1230 [Encephalitozoon cuniculi GB-M1]AGE96534.1 hypothetical protein ECU09_1230 [Encephalitozoon cuniculi]KMV65390.1 hypothetical protein M970_091210 [Encephalitozoon cuniculi EcunIII-L]UYI26810.1 hypothetical protein J0A71_03g06470 [Encephalitozoon cuniculi]CAD27093.1 hypothetical protein [Encephalitozoon cuniculi GB-M1]
MNPRPKKPTSRYSFEPKIPQTQEVFEVEEPVAKKEFSFEGQEEHTLKPVGSDAPEHLFALREHDGLILTLPPSTEPPRIVLYEDGSCGLRVGDEVYPMAVRPVGESLAIEHRDAAYGIGSAKFHLTPQIQGDKRGRSP